MAAQDSLHYHDSLLPRDTTARAQTNTKLPRYACSRDVRMRILPCIQGIMVIPTRGLGLYLHV